MRLPFLYERLTLLKIDYYIPDYQHIIQEFVWELIDIPPEFPRVMLFLDHWHKHIEAVIKEVYLANSLITNNKFINAKEILRH
jgi:uncharacterized protein Usg